MKNNTFFFFKHLLEDSCHFLFLFICCFCRFQVFNNIFFVEIFSALIIVFLTKTVLLVVWLLALKFDKRRPKEETESEREGESEDLITTQWTIHHLALRTSIFCLMFLTSRKNHFSQFSYSIINNKNYILEFLQNCKDPYIGQRMDVVLISGFDSTWREISFFDECGSIVMRWEIQRKFSIATLTLTPLPHNPQS